MQLGLGLNVIRSYKRLAYKEWYALAEFVDNSTQSYFNDKEALDPAFALEGAGLEVRVVYDAAEGVLRITDNAMGMSEAEMEAALTVGMVPANNSGRSQYGMGLKTAACWFGDKWTIRTKKLGETVERTVEVDVEAVADGNDELPTRVKENRDADAHYTVLEICCLHRKMQGRT